MANDKDFIVKNAVEVGGSVKTTVGTLTSGSEGYYLAGASYDSKSFSVSSQATGLHCVQFKSDGTKMYVATQQTASAVYQYSLSTAWDVSTASYDSVSFDLTSQLSGAQVSSLFFSSDGTAMYAGGTTADAIYQYTLSTAWDLSTASYASKSLSVSSQDTNPRAVFFKSDGTRLFLSGITGDNVYQYSLTTAWDISTASYDSVSFSVSTQDTTPMGLWFSSSGQTMFVFGDSNDTVFQYTLSTAWDVSSASYASISFSTSSEETTSRGLAFSADGTKMFAVGSGNNTVYQYSTVLNTETLDLSTGNYFNDTLADNTKYIFSNAGAVQSFQIEVTGGVEAGYSIENLAYETTLDVSPQGGTGTSPVGIAFKPDGTKMFYLDTGTNDSVFSYDLSTAWDISTATYDTSFDVSTNGGTSTRGLYFNPDGNRMFIISNTNSTIIRYNLSTAWDVSTASFSQSNSEPEAATGDAIYITPDGDILFMLASGTGGFDYIHSWNMSGFSITSLTGQKTLDVTTTSNNPTGIQFSDNGTKMYLSTNDTDNIYRYTLSTAYDISTASYDSVLSPSYNSQSNQSDCFVFSADGQKAYIGDLTADAFFQFSTISPATITWPTSVEWPNGVTPDATSNGKSDLFTIHTDDGGITYYGFQTADDLS